MLTPYTRRAQPAGDPMAGGLRARFRPLAGPMDANGIGGDAGPDAAPASGPSVAPARAVQTASPVAGATQPLPGGGGGAGSQITQLSDGAGGVIPVPPVAVTAPGIFGAIAAHRPGLTPSPSPSDATPSIPGAPPTLPGTDAGGAVPVDEPAPWEAAAPGTFNATDNLINSEVTPGAGDPSRIDLAKDYFGQLGTQANRDFSHGITDATNAAASHGQIGSGMLTNRYGDLAAQLNETQQLAARGLATDAAAGTIADNRSNRGEVRTERGYQSDLAQKALAQRIAQQTAEQGATQQAFDNAARLYGFGNANNPGTAYETAAGQATSEAGGNASSMDALIRAWLARQQTPAVA